MAAEKRMLFATQDQLHAEMAELRRSLLGMCAPAVLGLSWVWFTYSVISGWPLAAGSLATLALVLGSVGALRLRRSHYLAACWMLLLAMIAAQNVVLCAKPLPASFAFGVLIVIAASALLGARAGLLTAMLTWLANVSTRSLGLGQVGLWGGWDLLLLNLLTAAAMWLTAHPLETSITWALAGWSQAHSALLETRERRAELYRALRALEEATYRLEHANNELLVAQHDAEVARAMKGRLAATVSHELRGPLNLILGFSRLMANSPESYGEPLPRAYRADVDTIYRNTQHLVALVDDILDLSQIEAQRLPLVKDRIDLGEDVIRKAASIVQSLAERKGLYLRQELTGDLPWVLADQVRLRQALLNLLTNAVRFTERGGVTVEARRQQNEILVSVQDTGRGIAAKDMPRLFQEFQQVHLADTREGAGSGLGLSISKHLIELHGGRIWAESRQGAGTTFYFTVPLPDHEPAVGATVRTGELQPPSRAHNSCVIVHNDPGIIRLLGRYIEGYRVIGLPDETEVFRLTEEMHPAAIVTTPQLAQAVRDQVWRTAYDVPIITCAMPQVVGKDQFAGVIAYLVKPIAPEALGAVMRQVEREGETTVLLVDDDPDAVSLLERMLTLIPRPYRILKAYDGAQALQHMEAITPDVVIMDLVMPGLDGKGVLSRMRSNERLNDTPVVIISARDWIEGDISLSTPISVTCRGTVDLAKGARFIQAVLDGLWPRYLVQPTASGSPAVAAPGRLASRATRRLPVPGPRATG